jgi:UDP-glucose 4-epimerase
MNIGILGYKGFIGSHLLKYKDINKFIPLDLPLNWNMNGGEILELTNIDVLINAAGSANVTESFINPMNDFQSNVLLPLFLLEEIRKSKKNIKFLNFSSAAVYGNPDELPILDSFNKKPLSPYGFNKSISEEILSSYCVNFGIPTLSMRIFSCYGNGNRKQVFWDLCNNMSAFSNQGLIVHGSPMDTRDFIHIDDLVLQVLLVLKNDILFDGGSVNIGNGKQTEIGYLATLISEQFGCREFKFSGENMKGYPTNWEADISKQKKLGYAQTVSIEAGVISYCNWFKNLNKIV